MFKRYFLKTSLCLACLAPLGACSLALTGTVGADGRTELEVKTRFKPKAALLLTSPGAEGGAERPLDADFINKGLSHSPGIERAAFKNTPGGGIEGPVTVRDIGAFSPRSAPPMARALVFESRPSGGKLALRLNRETGRDLLLSFSEDVNDYVSALFAPIATGERLDEAEYLELVASVYGKPLAEEIGASTITLALRFPAAVKSAAGARFDKDRAVFDIPLLQALVLQRELYYEVVW